MRSRHYSRYSRYDEPDEVSSDVVEKYARELVKVRKEEGKAVSLTFLKQKIVSEFDEGSIKLREVPTLLEVEKTERQVNAFITSYLSIHTLITAWQLQKDLCAEMRVKKYEQLGLGPFIKNELVERFFQPPEGLDFVPHIEPFDVVRALYNYRWNVCRTNYVEHEAFMRHLGEQHNRYDGASRAGC